MESWQGWLDAAVSRSERSERSLADTFKFVKVKRRGKPLGFGRMAEWSNAAVSKTVRLQGLAGSNPAPSVNEATTYATKGRVSCSVEFIPKPANAILGTRCLEIAESLGKGEYKKLELGSEYGAKTVLMNKSIYKNPWFVYIVECVDKTLYSGIALDVGRRLKEHNNTKKCRYTRTRQPVKLVYCKKYKNHEFAIKREIEIKSFSRDRKLQLIKGV